ncbi:DNA-processing protein DprA [Metabacillus sp. RGM 3146]|uniref:DNA-processing protein DprA n=1 Tax=Metabacillus sp. RGM 3146 TaxID=3401092 RepID=UPI003B9D6AD7
MKGSIQITPEARDYLFRLTNCRGITNKGIHRLLQISPTLSQFFSLSEKDLLNYKIIEKRNLAFFLQDFYNFNPMPILAEYLEKGIFFITIADPEYPDLLREIYNCPVILYGIGNIEFLTFPKKISIVGTRTPTREGKLAIQKIVPELVSSGWLVVSGLAKGIDTWAHQAAMDSSGKTISVIGSGFDYLYPASNKELAANIMKNHLLLTEYKPAMKPQKWHFPERNRIIAGLSAGTIVIQAKMRSGSLITAQMAMEEGREVFAVPGPIHLENAGGTNKLIQDGAKLVMSARDVEDEFASFQTLPSMKEMLRK